MVGGDTKGSLKGLFGRHQTYSKMIAHCNVRVIRSHTEGPKVYSISVPPSNINHHFGKLLESGKGADITFKVDGEMFTAHKLALAPRSPVFRALIYRPMKYQNTSLIKLQT